MPPQNSIGCYLGRWEKYKIIGINEQEPLNRFYATTISFDESSEITTIPVTHINCCKSMFFLPPKIKRVKGEYRDHINENMSPIIVCDKSNKFVSIENKRSIVNLHPFEVLYQHLIRKRISIRETTRIIGGGAFINNSVIESVVIPPSVVIITDFAFNECINLRRIEFSGDSAL